MFVRKGQDVQVITVTVTDTDTEERQKRLEPGYQKNISMGGVVKYRAVIEIVTSPCGGGGVVDALAAIRAAGARWLGGSVAAIGLSHMLRATYRDGDCPGTSQHRTDD